NLDVRPDNKTVFYFAGIDRARFKRPVEPGDQLKLHVTLDRMKAGIVKFTSEARVADAIVAEAELMCTMRTVG
ncbi:MAG: 3-hydroxyacyl-[acyl-carrier-protein] dehydratase FabZ, partial [Caldimonas sp.]